MIDIKEIGIQVPSAYDEATNVTVGACMIV